MPESFIGKPSALDAWATPKASADVVHDVAQIQHDEPRTSDARQTTETIQKVVSEVKEETCFVCEKMGSGKWVPEGEFICFACMRAPFERDSGAAGESWTDDCNDRHQVPCLTESGHTDRLKRDAQRSGEARQTSQSSQKVPKDVSAYDAVDDESVDAILSEHWDLYEKAAHRASLVAAWLSGKHAGNKLCARCDDIVMERVSEAAPSPGGKRCHACDQVRDDVGEFPDALPLCAQCTKAHRMGYRCGQEFPVERETAEEQHLADSVRRFRAENTRLGHENERLRRERACLNCRATTGLTDKGVCDDERLCGLRRAADRNPTAGPGRVYGAKAPPGHPVQPGYDVALAEDSIERMAPYGRCSTCSAALTLPPSFAGMIGPSYCGDCWRKQCAASAVTVDAATSGAPGTATRGETSSGAPSASSTSEPVPPAGDGQRIESGTSASPMSGSPATPPAPSAPNACKAVHDWKAAAKEFRANAKFNFRQYQQYRRMYREATGELASPSSSAAPKDSWVLAERDYYEAQAKRLLEDVRLLRRFADYVIGDACDVDCQCCDDFVRSAKHTLTKVSNPRYRWDAQTGTAVEVAPFTSDPRGSK